MGGWNIHHLSHVLESMGWMGYIVGALLVLLQTLFPFVPFIFVAGVNVLLFGFWIGYIVNYSFACIGAISAYYLARNVGRTWVQNKLKKYSYIEKFNEKLERHGLLYISLSRIIPVLPSFLINLGAAVMKVRPKDFILGTIIGKAPMIMLETLIGHDMMHFRHYKGRFLILSIIFVVMILIGHHYKNKWFKSDNKI